MASRGSCGPDCWADLNRDEYGRARLPRDRSAVTRRFEYGTGHGYFYIGFYPCGCPGELFIRFGTEGDLVRGLLDGFATMFSIALQHGAPAEGLIAKCKYTSFGEGGPTGDGDHPMASSMLDHVCGLVESILKNEEHPVIKELRESYARERHRDGAGEAGMQEDSAEGQGGVGDVPE